ncbi:hypothetical protein [Candidatus Parabeggiatoa sp. HSG14]|uniref:hypothetical protein n=1 Tax=Candidatus Parabeggiatoa sp. HSG14 TaxID=3055593 RepID=UPI0025A7AFCF|nr:hypothetical protein [Thiotrichales bacterium HSG14]
MKWKFQFLKNVKEFDEKLVTRIHQIFLDGFGLKKGWSLEGIRKSLTQSTILALLTEEKGDVSGYAIYSVPEVPLQGAYMLWEDSLCIMKHLRGKLSSGKLPKRAVENAVRFLREQYGDEYKFGWVGGRTQNPIVMKMYAQFGTIFPFDVLYSEKEGKEVMEYLLQHIAEVEEIKQLEKNNGICRSVYDSGRLGDYQVGIKGTEKFEEQLLKWNFNRQNGDAIIVVSKLNNPL